jgi:hypothetical protein
LWQNHFQPHRRQDRVAQSAPLRPRSQPQVVEGLSID